MKTLTLTPEETLLHSVLHQTIAHIIDEGSIQDVYRLYSLISQFRASQLDIFIQQKQQQPQLHLLKCCSNEAKEPLRAA